MKIEVTYNIEYGFRKLIFKKEFEMPNLPCLGHSIYDYNKDYDFFEELKKDKTYIYYDCQKQKGHVDIIINLNYITSNQIDSQLKKFESLNWLRTDTTDITEFKSFLKNYKNHL